MSTIRKKGKKWKNKTFLNLTDIFRDKRLKTNHIFSFIFRPDKHHEDTKKNFPLSNELAHNFEVRQLNCGNDRYTKTFVSG